MNPIALFDLDGCLVDYEGQMRADLATLRSPGEPDPLLIKNLWQSKKEPWLKARMKLIKMRPGWWRNLPPFKLGWDVFAMCQEIGFERQILTKGPTCKSHVWAEKVDYVRNNPDLKNCIVHISEAKGQVFGRVLVDDYGPYVTAWLEHRPRGLVIMPVHEYNVDYQHPNVIHYTGENEFEVRIALRAAFLRHDKQHWKDLTPENCF
jgi:5'-nucleotidase